MAPARRGPRLLTKYIIEDDPNTPDVTLDTVVWLFLENKLRGHVQYSTHPCACFPDIFFPQLLCKPKIRQLCPAILQQNILRLDIPVCDPQIIQQASSIDDVLQQGYGLFFTQTPFHPDKILQIP